MSFLSSKLARRTLALSLAGLAVLIGIVTASIWLAASTKDHANAVAQAREVRTVSSLLLGWLVDAETGQRGFLLTGDPAYLDPYNAAIINLERDFTRMSVAIQDAPDLLPALERLKKVSGLKMAELGETIEFAKAGRHDEALEIVTSARGKVAMDEARAILDEIINRSEGRVLDVLKQLNDAANLLTGANAIGGLLVVLFAAGAFVTVVKYTRDLVAARQEVEQLNVGLEDRVAERTAALSQANDEIQRFAYIVSHDLRAPLVNIMGFTSELEMGTAALQKYIDDADADATLKEDARTAAKEDLPEAVRFIRASTAKMDRLINAILKLSREGRRELRAEHVDLKAIFTTAAASIHHQTEEVGAQIELAPTFPAITSDRLALEQVFGNLLDNAVKYLAPGRPGRIRVEAGNYGKYIRLKIIDNGRGVAEEDHERIFELFRRSGVQDRKGEGIGLAHVRALVRRLGGDITIQSRLGEGATFEIILPRILKIDESETAS